MDAAIIGHVRDRHLALVSERYSEVVVERTGHDRAPVVEVAHVDLDRKHRSVPTSPHPITHGILDGDAPEQPSALASGTDRVEHGALVGVQVPPRDQLARRR